MTTSANVIEFRIEKGDKEVGNFSRHLMCRLPDYADLLKYQPLKEHTITPWGYDEEEELWEEEPENLEVFLKKIIPYNKLIREYFENLP